MRDAHQELEAMRSAGAWRIWEPLYHKRDWCKGYGFHIALMAIIAVFGLGGYETTANSIIWTLYLLAKHHRCKWL